MYRASHFPIGCKCDMSTDNVGSEKEESSIGEALEQHEKISYTVGRGARLFDAIPPWSLPPVHADAGGHASATAC